MKPKKDNKIIKAINKTIEQRQNHMVSRSASILDKTLDKVERLQEETKDEFDKAVDYYALKVADTILNNVRKERELQLKEKADKRENASFFHQMLKDASSGNISKEELDRLEMYVKRDQKDD